MVHDAMGPVHQFTSTGANVGSIAAPQGFGLFTQPLAILSDGSILHSASNPTPAGITEPTDGNLWVRETEFEDLLPAGGFRPVSPVPSRWSIFATDGTWLGTVDTPASFFVLDIGDGHVTGVGRDDLGIERVLVYDLRR